MNRPLSLLTTAVATAALAAGCTATAPRVAEESAKDAAKLAAARAHAGAPVQHVTFLRPIYRYEVVDPHALLVWETTSKAWLLDLRPSPACKRLEQTFSVAVESMAATIDTRTGYVRGDHGINCKVDGIREVNVQAMRETLRESGNG